MAEIHTAVVNESSTVSVASLTYFTDTNKKAVHMDSLPAHRIDGQAGGWNNAIICTYISCLKV